MSRASVVIPVHGNAALTRRCLDLVLADLPAGCEVVVVDDASTDETPEVLRSFGERIQVITLAENAGFARACNQGAAAAAGELLVFLNNDTEPRAGWLETLLGYVEREPAAAVVGAKLVYPTGTVQHAGVVFGQDGYPHNLYAGLPEDHAAVNRSRQLQAVTAACMLVRRDAFEAVGGFDEGYENSLEDVDLCLRIGAGGGEAHYCHEAVVVHLESISRGRRDRFQRSVDLYRRRWREQVRRDDLSVYAEDGLIEVEYPASYPLRLSVSPQLASVDDAREAEVEGLLESYARRTSDLLAEVMRLSALAGVPAEPMDADREAGRSTDHRALLAEASRLEAEARTLQERLAKAGDGDFAPAEQLGYSRLVERIRAAAREEVPDGARVLVVSRGDRDLVDLGDLEAGHFPQDPQGRYLGHHPRDSEDAIAQLEALRESGAEYLLLPATSSWWLDHYEGLAAHLRKRCEATDLGFCTIYRLAPLRAPAPREKVG
ncbi:MAG: glycosyltransferase family 2 protein [Solirubrobacterales bacterium]